MSIYISTNLYRPEQLKEIFQLLDKIGDPAVGIELFPEWQSEVFCRELAEHMEEFRRYLISLHGPYYCTEHSKPEGTEEYARAMQYFYQTLELSQRLKSRYIVYHHNNCRVEPMNREEMIRVSTENLTKLRGEAERFHTQLVIENAGVLSRGNMLFDEEQFIHMAQSMPENILLDVGHAHANGWDISNVIAKLAHKIIAYHMHNNNGCEDNHNRIHDGTLDFAQLLACYKKYTPQADIVIEYGPQCAQDRDGIIQDVAYIKKALNCKQTT
jgi:sugar phosphate isomerase/epimerase